MHGCAFLGWARMRSTDARLLACYFICYALQAVGPGYGMAKAPFLRVRRRLGPGAQALRFQGCRSSPATNNGTKRLHMYF